MTIQEAREIAAQCWCHPTTENIEMDVRLAEVFAQTLYDHRHEALGFIESAIRNYRGEMENPVKDQTMIQQRRRELFALVKP